MSWRTVVVSKRAKLELKLDYVVIRTDEILKIHISEIGVLIIESTAVSITTALISECCKRKILLIICDEKRNPCASMLHLYGSYESAGKLREQISWSQQLKGDVWSKVVAEKIHRQRIVLLNSGLIDEYEKLSQYLNEIEYNDASNREGHAAKVYFNSLFGPRFSRSNDSVINGALDYGYAVILSLISREIVCSGYSTQLGVFHSSQTNPFNLSCDLMEPIRPIIDGHILKVDFKESEELDHKSKMKILEVLNEEVIFSEKKQTLLNAAKLYVRSVFRAMEANDATLIRFIKYEL